MLCEAFGDDAAPNVISLLPVDPSTADDGLLFFGSKFIDVTFGVHSLLLHRVDLLLHALDELILVEAFCVVDDRLQENTF